MTLTDAVPTPPEPSGRPRRRAAAVVGVVGVAVVLGGGTWAWQLWSAQGPQPAEALPTSTLAYVAVDLDPPGGQKVAAYDALRRFPTLTKELGLGSKDDLREAIAGEVTSESGCGLDKDAITSWAGDRAALAVVPLEEPEVVAVVEVGDRAKAEDRLTEIAEACGDGKFGFVVGESWAVLAETEAIARQVTSDAEGSTLAEDGDFQELTGAAGDAGVLTLFVAPEAGDALLAAVEEEPFLVYSLFPLASPLDPVSSLIGAVRFLEPLGHSYGTYDSGDQVVTEIEADDMPPMSREENRLMDRMNNMDELSQAEQDALMKEYDAFLEEKYGSMDEPTEEEIIDEAELEGDDWGAPELSPELRKSLTHFTGAGGVLRFDDGTLELEVVADPLLGGFEGRYDGTDGLAAVAALPADTVLAFGGGLAEGWAQRAVTDNPIPFGPTESEAELVASFEKATGLSVEDLEALGGDHIAFAAGPGFDRALESETVPDFPVAVRIAGDADEIEAALARLTVAGERGDLVKSKRTDDGVVVGPSASYLEDLVSPAETLGDSDLLERAVPDAEDATIVFYAGVGDGGWLDFLSDGGVPKKDAAVLDAVGTSVTKDGSWNRLLVRVSLD